MPQNGGFVSMSFHIFDKDERVRLTAYDAKIAGTVTTLRITVEITDAYKLAHMLQDLEELKQKHRITAGRLVRQPAPATKASPAKPTRTPRVDQQRLLALPAPTED
jgi:hypothetical protein